MTVYYRRFPQNFDADNYAVLRTRAGRAGAVAYVYGRETARDGGEGTFVWRVGTATDNDGTILAGPAGSGGYWQRVTGGEVTRAKNATGSAISAGSVCKVSWDAASSIETVAPFDPNGYVAGLVKLAYAPFTIPSGSVGVVVCDGLIHIDTTGFIENSRAWISSTSTVTSAPDAFPYPCGTVLSVGASGTVYFQGGLGRPSSITPEDFGAVGDGTGDHSVALQRWINTGLRENVACEGFGTYRHGSTLYVDPQLAGCPDGSPIRRTWVVRGAGHIMFNFNDTSHGAHLRLLKFGNGHQIVRRLPTTGYSYSQSNVNAQGIAFVRQDGSDGHGWLDLDSRDASGNPCTPALPQFREVSFFGHHGIERTLTITNVTTLADGRAEITTSAAHGLRMFEYISIEGVVGPTILNDFCGHVHSTPTATTFTIAMEPNAAYVSGGTVEVMSCGFTVDQPFSYAGVGGAEEGYVYTDWDGVSFQECGVGHVLGRNWNSSFRGVRLDLCTFGGSVGLTSSRYDRGLVQGFTRHDGTHTKLLGLIVSPDRNAVMDMMHLEDLSLPVAIDVRPWRNASAVNKGTELVVQNSRRGGSPCKIRCIAQPNEGTGVTAGDVATVAIKNFSGASVEFAQWKEDLGAFGHGNAFSDDYEVVAFNVGSASAYTGSPRCSVRIWKGKTLYDNQNGLHGSVVPIFGPGSEFVVPITIPAMAVGATWDGAFAVSSSITPDIEDTDIVIWDVPSGWPAQIQAQFQAHSGDRLYVKGVNAGSGAYAGGGPFDVKFYFLRRPNYGV